MSSEPENQNPAGGEAPPPAPEERQPESESGVPPPDRRRRKRSRGLLLAAAAIILSVALYNALLARTLGAQEVHLYGQDRWAPGLPASLRVVLIRHRDQRPIQDASVRILLSRPKAEIVELASGHTDAAGTIEPGFTVPEGEGPARLVVMAESPSGRDFVDRPIRLVPAYRVLLASDQPAYRAGQRVRLVAGVSREGTGDPAGGRPLSLRAFAPGGIPFAVRSARTDEHGGAAAEFELAPDAPTGLYRFKASVGASAVELSLPVTAAAEAAFPVSLGSVSRFAAPGGLVRGYVAAQDRLGSHLRGATARVWMESATGRAVSWTSGPLDLQGRLSFGLRAPQVAEPARYRLYAEVTDAGMRSARAMQVVAVTPHPIEMIAVPEARTLVAGVANRVFLAARYPDGTPAQATIRYTLGSRTGQVQCSPLGVASITLMPGREGSSLVLAASDADGYTGSEECPLPLALPAEAEWTLRERFRVHTGRPEDGSRPQPFLLRPDRGLYRAGDMVGIEVLAPGSGETVYVDGVAGGQSVFSRSAALRRGQALLKVRLPEAVNGTLWLRAYTLGPWGDAAYAERAVFALPGPPPGLSLRVDRPSYEPAQAARMALASRGAGAVGFAVTRSSAVVMPQQMLAVPGSLLVPLRPGVPGAVHGWEEAAWRSASEKERQDAALATLALAPRLEGWSLHEDTYARKRAALQARQAASWAWLRWMVLVLLAVIWLVATRVLSQSSGSAGDAENGSSHTLASAARFVALTVGVALGATLLLRMVGPGRLPERGDTTHSLLTSLQEEREKQAHRLMQDAPSLPPAVPESVTVPEVGFWALGQHPGSRPRAERSFRAPAALGDWVASAQVLAGPDAPARAAVPLRVDGELAVEFEPPAAARPGDVVSVGVRVRNPHPEPRHARLKLMAGPGLGVVGEPAWDEEIPGGAGITRALRVAVANRPGHSPVTLAVSGPQRSVVLRREIETVGASATTTVLQAGRASKPITYQVDVSGQVAQAGVSLQATPAAIATARLAALPRALPFSTLERAAALDIARIALQTGGADPRAAQAALESGFQELLACRDQAGWFAGRPGDAPDPVVTAYVVFVLSAARDLIPGADTVARQANRWLRRQHAAPTEWPAPWGESEADAAFAAWALGPGGPAAHELRARYRLHGIRHKDPYLLSLLALGAGERLSRQGMAADPVAGAQPSLLEHLASLATAADAGEYWVSPGRTLQGFTGKESAVETTSLAVLALASQSRHREHAQRGADYLASVRGPEGGWGGLFSTSLALRALIAASPAKASSGSLNVAVNGQDVARLDARSPRADIAGRLARGENSVSLTPSGGEGVLYELAVSGPNAAPEESAGAPGLSWDVMPRRVRPGRTVKLTARVSGDVPRPVRIEIPLPPGFRAMRGDLEEMVQSGEAVGFFVGARRLWIDLDTGRRHQARWVELRLAAPGPCSVLAPSPTAYPVADPGARASGQAIRLTVE